MHKKSVLFLLLIISVFGAFVYYGSKRAPSVSVPDVLPSQKVVLKDGETYTLTAGYVMNTIGGRKVKMLAYNGMIPGPEIRVNEGDKVTIHFVNMFDMPTLLHAHGIRMDNQWDGSPLVQSDIRPGTSFDYLLHFPDPGMYWYHPHVREDKQQPMGLFGVFIVASKDPNYWSKVDHEESLVLSDIYMENGNIAPYSDKYVTHALMGRFGNTQLVNGKENPTFIGAPGEVHRLFLLNAASVRPFNIQISGGAQMKLIGGDNGKYEKETFVDAITLGPSERVIVDVYFPTAGTYAIVNKTPTATYPLGKFTISGTPVNGAQSTEQLLRSDAAWGVQFASARTYLAKEPDQTIRLTLNTDMNKIMTLMGGGMNGMVMGTSSMAGHVAQPIEWDDTMGDMNTFSTSDTVKWIMHDEKTGKENTDIVWKFKKGDLVKIHIVNDPTSMHPMQHPVHFHGNRFLVLATNGVPNDNMGWDDTVLLKTGDSVDILLETSNVGKWLAHCHISEHMESGMMMEYDIE